MIRQTSGRRAQQIGAPTQRQIKDAYRKRMLERARADRKAAGTTPKSGGR